MEQKVFLTASWNKLIMANYAVDPGILKEYVPAGTEIDSWNNTCYISLVGFMFTNVKVKGIAVPFHRTFPEVNLRFYVRRKEGDHWKRGVVFISEIVPRPAISFIANTIYKEHYSTLPMKHYTDSNESHIHTAYNWKKKGYWNTLKVTADAMPMALQNGSEEEFITEHFWGYAKGNGRQSVEYQVAHPRWDIHRVKEYVVDCDFGTVYGKEFGFLVMQQPVSVFLAEGSPIKVYNRKLLS